MNDYMKRFNFTSEIPVLINNVNEAIKPYEEIQPFGKIYDYLLVDGFIKYIKIETMNDYKRTIFFENDRDFYIFIKEIMQQAINYYEWTAKTGKYDFIVMAAKWKSRECRDLITKIERKCD